MSTLNSPGNIGLIRYTNSIVKIDITIVIIIEFPVIIFDCSSFFSPIVFESSAILAVLRDYMFICIMSIITPIAPIAPTALVPNVVTTRVSINVIKRFTKFSKAIGNDIFSCFFAVNSSFIFPPI